MDSNHFFAVATHGMTAFGADVFFGYVLLYARTNGFAAIRFGIYSVGVATVPANHFVTVSLLPKEGGDDLTDLGGQTGGCIVKD